MSLISVLIVIILIAVIAFVAHWIITQFFPEPVKMPALVIVGVILLLFLLLQLFPDIGTIRAIR